MRIINLIFEPDKSLDLKKRLEERAKTNLEHINQALTSKKEFIINLTGQKAVEYIKTLCKLFDAAYENIPINTLFVENAITTFVEELWILNDLNQIYEVDQWKDKKVQFKSLADIDVDIRTGMPILTDLNLKIEMAKKFSKTPRVGVIEQFFNKLMHNPKDKPTVIDYLQLLREANKNKLASVSFPNLLKSDKLVLNASYVDGTVDCIYYQYGVNSNSFEFILIDFDYKDLFPKRGIIEKMSYAEVYKEVKRKGDLEIIINPKFKDFFKIQATNDARFIYLQMRQLLKENFGLDVGLFSVDTLSFGIRIPLIESQDSQVAFPELGGEYLKKDNRLVIRHQYCLGDVDGTIRKNTVKYKIITGDQKCQME